MSIQSFFRSLTGFISSPSSSSEEGQEDEGMPVDLLPVEVSSRIFDCLSGREVFSYALVSDAARVQAILYANHRSKKALNSLKRGSEAFSKAVNVLKIVLNKRMDLLPTLESGDMDVLSNCLEELQLPLLSDQVFLPFILQKEGEELDLSLAVSISNRFDFVRGVFSTLDALDRLDILIKAEFERILMPLNPMLMEELRTLLVPLFNCVCDHFSWKITDGEVDELLESCSKEVLQKFLEKNFLEEETSRSGTVTHIFLERLYKLISLGLSWDAFLFFTKVFGLSISRLHPGSLERMLKASMTRPDFVSQLLQLPVKMEPVLLNNEIYQAYPPYACLSIFFLQGNQEKYSQAMRSCYEILTKSSSCKQAYKGVFSNIFLAALIDCKEAVQTLLEKPFSLEMLKPPLPSHANSIVIYHQGLGVSMLHDVVMRRYVTRFSSVFPQCFPTNAVGQLDREFLKNLPFISFFRLAILNLDLFAVRSLLRRGVMEPLEKSNFVGDLTVTALADICFPLEPFHDESPKDQGKMAALLMENGANVNATVIEGITILMLACRLSGWYSRAFLIQELLLHGANVNAVDNSGNTALHYLAQSNPSEELLGEYRMIFRLLLVNNTVLNARNMEGRTAVDVAQIFGNEIFLGLAIETEGLIVDSEV
ncbi:ankyrin repeat domain-containing protein [Chlamydiifrater phoenicopteri]|uniref:ankyrin repeat domain-containing protein n=1 Tax=Chlamydiifrater phoenicopteri TaxID=2681469 RepID=UPI001BCF6621|nr:ankyrin repeat domain-containing protein [Chlamydiifrater phoenicopteri]